MPKSEIEDTIELNGEELDFAAEVEYSIGNDGIGPYEFWGQNCFDKGRNYMEEIILEKVFIKGETLTSGAVFDAVDKFIQNNFDKFATEIMEQYFDNKMDYPDIER